MSVALTKYGMPKQIPNSLAGRKIRDFLHELDSYYEWWNQEKIKISKILNKIPDDEQYNLAKNYLSYLHYRDGKLTSEADIAIEIENQSSKYKKAYNEYEIESKHISYNQARNHIVGSYAKAYLLAGHAKKNINGRFFPFFDEKRNRGYCSASVMECLRRSDKKYELRALFNTDWENLIHPVSLFNHIAEMENAKYAKHIYPCDKKNGQSIQEVIQNCKIKPGALACITYDCYEEVSLQGKHNHLVVYTGMNKYKQPYFTSFDEDMIDGMINAHNKGYVLDTYSLVSDVVEAFYWGKINKNTKDMEENEPIKLKNFKGLSR